MLWVWVQPNECTMLIGSLIIDFWQISITPTKPTQEILWACKRAGVLPRGIKTSESKSSTSKISRSPSKTRERGRRTRRKRKKRSVKMSSRQRQLMHLASRAGLPSIISGNCKIYFPRIGMRRKKSCLCRTRAVKLTRVSTPARTVSRMEFQSRPPTVPPHRRLPQITLPHWVIWRP